MRLGKDVFLIPMKRVRKESRSKMRKESGLVRDNAERMESAGRRKNKCRQSAWLS